MAIYVITTGEYSDQVIQGVIESDLTKEQVVEMGRRFDAVIEDADRRADAVGRCCTDILKADGYKTTPEDMDFDTNSYFLDWFQKTYPEVKFIPWTEIGFGEFRNWRIRK